MILIMDNDNLFFYVALSFAAHEAGHIAAFKVMGRQINQARLTPFGMEINMVQSTASYKEEVKAALFGPLVNLLLCALFALNRNLPAAYINAALFIFNMLPVPQLDGGRVLCSLLSLHFSPSFSEKCVGVTGLFSTAFVFTLLFMSSRLGSMNITLFLSAAYLTFLSLSGCGILRR